MNFTNEEELSLLTSFLISDNYVDGKLDLDNLINKINAIEGKEIFKIEDVQQYIDFHGLDVTGIVRKHILFDEFKNL